MAKPIENPDVTNEDPIYWEQVLASHGLSMKRGYQPNKQASVGSTNTIDYLQMAADQRAVELGGNGTGFDVRKVEPKGKGVDN